MRPALVGATVLMGLVVVYWTGLFVWQRALLFQHHRWRGWRLGPVTRKSSGLRLLGLQWRRGISRRWSVPAARLRSSCLLMGTAN